MRRLSLLLALLLPLAAPPPAGAQTLDSTLARRDRPDAPRRPYEVQLRLGGSRTDNFFQTASSEPSRDVSAGTAELRLVHAFGDGGRSNVRLRGGATRFEGLPTAALAELASRMAGRSHALDVQLTGSFNSPRFEVGEALESADVAALSAEYMFLVTRALQLGVLGDVAREWYSSASRLDNTLRDVGGAARWRGFGAIFSPEVGYTVGRREVEDERESFDQKAVFVQLRSAPSRNVYASARYRRRFRDYDTENVLASNFGREDTRDQLTAALSFAPSVGPAWDLYYAWEDVESSRAIRSFTTQLLALGVTFRLGRW